MVFIKLFYYYIMSNNKIITRKQKKQSVKCNKKHTNKSIKNRNKKHTKKYKNLNKIYSKNDYSSSNGMLTSVWGPSMWHTLHIISFNYPMYPTKNDIKNYKNFILNLQYILPCSYCRKNLKNNFKKFPLKNKHMKNRNTFSYYIYQLHERINKCLNKKSNLSYMDVKERYEHFRSRCTINNKKEYIFNYKKEKGCTEPLYGEKSKCIIKIVPSNLKCNTFQIDKKCIKHR